MKKYKDKDWLKKQCEDNTKKMSDVAKECEVEETVLYYWINKFSLKKRNNIGRFSNINSLLRDKNWLQEQYEKLTAEEIADVLGCCHSTVLNYIEKYNIPKRKGFRDGKMTGANNPAWKGGVTKIYEKIRKSERYSDWRFSVFKRDNFTCVKCGDNSGGNLNADHIKPFSVILKENNINNLKDSYSCDELWNLDNGRTLCENCHKQTDTYGWKSYHKNLENFGASI